MPHKFGMFSDEGNQQVREAISKFLSSVSPLIGTPGLASPVERLSAFQDDELESAEGMFYDDYFG